MEFLVVSQSDGSLVAEGVTGEVLVRGRGVVHSYWNNPEASVAFETKVAGIDGTWFFLN